MGMGHEPPILGGYDISRLLGGISETEVLLNVTTDVPEPFYFLQDKNANQEMDFKAQSLAVSTQCVPMTSHCFQPNYSNPDTIMAFQCSPGFKGNLTMKSALDFDESGGAFIATPSLGIGFSPDAKFSRMIGSDLESA
jgi:hypothetical protein